MGDVGEVFERIVVHQPLNSRIPVTRQELVQSPELKDLKYLVIGKSMDEQKNIKNWEE